MGSRASSLLGATVVTEGRHLPPPTSGRELVSPLHHGRCGGQPIL